MDKKSWVAFIFIFLFVSLNVFAQGTTGRISGTINDPNGSVVQGATVRVINQERLAENR
ncbi:MAG: carboxypeptidase-like regulatory domain-containing protein [Acidobacteriota bacterium]|nr:carboxypeptidase-like regulatory domain-containing protein [Acidobacteriota bacterium]